MIGLANGFTNFLLVVSFLLLLLTSLSLPIIKSIWIMRATVSAGVSFLSVHDDITFGVWGLCIGTAKASILGFSDLKPGECTSPKLGYSSHFSSNSDITNLVHGSIAKALVLHPISAALTFLALVCSLLTSHHHHRTSHPSYTPSPSHHRRTLQTHIPTSALLFTLLATIFTIVTFILDIVFDSKARDAAKHTDGIVSVSYGNCTWMTLVAMLLLVFASVGACAGVVRERRRVARASGRY